MKRIVLTALVTAALAATGCGSMTAADCQLQSSANGPYIVKFTQAGALPAGCTQTDTPDTFADSWQFDPFENKLIVAFSLQSTLPIPANNPTPVPPQPDSPIYGKGHFSEQFPDANDLCTVPSLTTMQIDYPTAPSRTYAVTNLQFLSTAIYLGTEFKGEVTYTNGACSRPYTMQALNPAVQCGTKEDCDPFSQPFASGINSKYNTDCIKEAWATDSTGDPDTGYCFFVGEFPSNDGWKPVSP